MKELAVLTTTRAEYGLLSNLIRKLMQEPMWNVSVLVTGTHLLKSQGHTIDEIKKDGIAVAHTIEIFEEGESCNVTDVLGKVVIEFGKLFMDEHYDALVVLGDRYETLGVCEAAMLNRIPIVHLHGGETTQGAVDEAIRHSITKMSYLHFTSTSAYRNRVIQMGENPQRVFDVGALGVENTLHTTLYDQREIREELGIADGKPYIVMTYHPVTLEDTAKQQAYEFLKVFEKLERYDIVITKANEDAGGRIINEVFEAYSKEHAHVRVFASLGKKRYLSAVKYASFVLGNSSSGIIEVPSFGVPTVNVGDRQKGRIRAESVVDAAVDYESILDAIQMVEGSAFQKKASMIVNPYGDGNTSDRIVDILHQWFTQGTPDLKKAFYDIDI